MKYLAANLSNLLILTIFPMAVANSAFAGPPPGDYSLNAMRRGYLAIEHLGNKVIAIRINQSNDVGRESLATQLNKAFHISSRPDVVDIRIHEDSCIFESKLLFYCDLPNGLESKVLLTTPAGKVMHEFNNEKDSIRLFFWMKEVQEKSILSTNPYHIVTENTGALVLQLMIREGGSERYASTNIINEVYRSPY